jgi:hypothetical protein
MSSSSAFLPKQYWYTGLTGASTFRDASEYTLFKKRQSFYQTKNFSTNYSTLSVTQSQSLQNNISFRFAYIGCTGGVGATGGQFPTDIRFGATGGYL